MEEEEGGRGEKKARRGRNGIKIFSNTKGIRCSRTHNLSADQTTNRGSIVKLLP